MLIFNDRRYDELSQQHAPEYAGAEPFPHVVLDDFLPPEWCDRVLEEFPRADRADWMRFEKHHSRKLATKKESQLGPTTRQLIHQLHGPDCLQFLENLTGIKGLMPDPYLEGGGLHQIEQGGYLKMHVDFNFHRRLTLHRRLNLIVYLNRDWREEYNGQLELWDREMTRCVRKVLPVYNRVVVFTTSNISYHGHPEKLTCPPEMSRKSLALYYYTSTPGSETEAEEHGTLWQEKPAAIDHKGLARRTATTVMSGVAGVLEWPGKLARQLAQRLAG